VAYARVYAEHDEALTEQLARIALPRAGKPRKASAPKAPGTDAAPPEVEAAESAVVSPAAEPSEAADEAPTPVLSGSRKTKRRLGPPRDAAQSRPD
jgi:hypothetical protein